jgi:CelD/BcsL family acetyltransferase involved in cellulose biosynthesis
VAEALASALSRCDRRSVALAAHQRALLAPAADRTHYLDHAVGSKKRKELRRQRKRLAEAGTLVSDNVREPSAMAAALGDFLKLEAAGWKGRAGTAARADERVRAFMEEAVIGLARDGKAHIARLATGGAPITAIVTLRSGATAWCWKIAYDETYARFSPGVQLLLEVTQAMLDDPGLAGADSCATADHPMIDHIWRERLRLADHLVQLRPRQPGSFAAVLMLERLRGAALQSLKRLRSLVRRRP